MVLGKHPVPGRPTILITVGQGPIALAVGAGGGGLEFLLSSILSLLSPSLWETARYRLKYWLVVLGLTALGDSISVYIGPSPREREKEMRNDS